MLCTEIDLQKHPEARCMFSVQTQFSKTLTCDSVTVTGCTDEWFLHRDPREAGVLLTTQTHALGSWATLFPTVPGTNHSLGPRRCLLRNERQARQGATQVWLFNMQQEKQDSLLFISNIDTERKGRKDFTFYTYFFERSPKYNIKGNIGSIVTSQ